MSQALSGPAVSIDLGTCNAVLAALIGAGEPRVIPNRRGQRKTRSVVAFTGGTVEIGVDPVGCPAGNVVRRVTDFVGDADWRYHHDGKSYRAEEIAAMILARLARDAGRLLGAPVTEAVLAVPATFDALARRAVADAAGIAGLRAVRIVNQPTAAALGYQVLSATSARPAARTVLVYALGAGTFDVSAQRLDPGGLEVLATHGDRTLGGWDFDDVLMRILQERLSVAGGPDLLRSEHGESYLRSRAQVVKHRLSMATSAEAVIRWDIDSWRVPVTRTEFEQAGAVLLDRTRALVRTTLLEASLDGTAPHRVLLVGGPTRMPMVRRMLRELVGVPLHSPGGVPPDEVVALGALLVAAPGRGRRARVREVATVGLGLLARDAATGSLHNVVVVPAGSSLPAGGRATLATSEDGQTRAMVQVTLGDGTDPRKVRVYGREVVALPAGPAGAPVEISCSYDAAQMPRLEVTGAIDHGATASVPVRAGAAMSKGELRTAAHRLETLLAG